MANTRDVMGEQACLDALLADTLTSFEDDGVTKIGSYCLQRRSTLTSVKLSQCKSIDAGGLQECPNLETVDIYGSGTISTNAFNNSKKLTHLVLRGPTMTALSSQTVLSSTNIGMGRGAVYVDSSLLADYKSSNAWKDFLITTLDKYPLSDFSTIEDDWSTIISKAENGTASQSYSIGDTKLIDLGTEGKVYAQIAGFGLDDLTSGGKAKVTFVTKGTLATRKRMNPSGSSGTQGTGANGGWEYCEMRAYLNDTVFALLPSELQSAIKSVTKYSGNIVPGEFTVTKDGCVTQDKLWIPSHREVFNESTYEENGPVYYELFPSTNQSSRVKRDQSGSAMAWWLRSAFSTAGFRGVSYSGGATSLNADYTYSVVIGFCI